MKGKGQRHFVNYRKFDSAEPSIQWVELIVVGAKNKKEAYEATVGPMLSFVQQGFIYRGVD